VAGGAEHLLHVVGRGRGALLTAALAAGVARQALRELGALEPTLTGLQRDDARFLLLLANYQLGINDEVCRVGAQVISSNLLHPDQVALARTMRSTVSCP